MACSASSGTWRRAGACALVAIAWSAAAVAAAPPATRVVLPTTVVPSAYRIAIEPHADGAAFDGSVEIDLRVVRATDRIVLNSAELAIDRASLDGDPAAPTIAYDAKRQDATLAFGHRLAPGRHVLRLAYRGKIQDHASGLFRLEADTPAGKQRALFTQFENSDARRFVPCWDEPGIKAVFELTATVPANEMAVGNMPIASTDELPDGRKRVRFAPTPRMSSYLLFFGLGDFERVHRDVQGVDVGVIVKRGDTSRAAFALDTAAQVLAYYNDYFGVAYPLPKLDLIAGAGASTQFGAMENWGAIFYFERYLLVDPLIATESDRQDIYAVIAHEMAHQWFGDLVTMAWWDDLWLNEGFASWMQVKAADHAHPEWKRWLRTLRGKQRVMDVDARDGTHPVVTPIDDVEQAAIAFDAITYTKGAQVIRTLETWVGEDAFRDGVRRYMKRHAYGNTVTDDLWRAMDERGGRPVTGIAHDLTLQAGVPLVTALSSRCAAGRTTVQLAQGHVAIDPASTTARRWRLPVAVALPGGAASRVLVAGAAPQSVVLDGCGPVIVNAGQVAYFRTRYAEAGLRELLARYATLASDDQLGIFNDTASLALLRLLPMATLMEVATTVPADADPLVVSALAQQLLDIDRLYDGLPSQARWRQVARRLLAPMLAAIGPRRVDGESANAAIARADLLAALAEVDDATTLADARDAFARYVADRGAALDPELRKFMLEVVAGHADEAAWESLHRLATEAPTMMERQEFYELLCTADDPALAARALALARSGEPPATSIPQMVAAVSRRHPALAFEFAQAHWDELSRRFEQGDDAYFMPGLVYSAPDAALAARLVAFGDAHIPANARKYLRAAVSNMRYRASIRRELLPQVDAWLATRDR